MPSQILHLLGTAAPEGTGEARIVTALIQGLDPRRYQVHAWFLMAGGPLAEEFQAAGIPVRVFHWQHGIRDPLAALRFWRRLRGENPAIVHQHFGGRSVRWLVRLATRAALVVHLHTRVLEPRGNVLFSPGAIPHVDAVIAVSRAIAEHFRDPRTRVIYPGLPSVLACQQLEVVRTETSGKVLGTACRLVSIKGLEHLIRAVSLLRAELPEIRLEIAGSGPEQAALEKEMRRLELQDHVTFLGWRTDLAALLPRWDVFVLPSLDEGLPIAALEAMAAGLPVVATAVGGVPELVEDGRTGWLVPPGNAEALAGRIRQLLLDPERARGMGTTGAAHARAQFSAERMVSSIEKLYGELLAARQSVS